MASAKEIREKKLFKKWEADRYRLVGEFISRKSVRKIFLKAVSNEVGSAPVLTNKEKILTEFSRRLSELNSSRYRLDLFPVLLSSYHKSLERRGRLSRSEQLTYHVQNYLSDVYIFEQRAKRLAKFITNNAEKLGCDVDDIKALKESLKNLSATLEKVVEVRGKHIHEDGFSDNELTRLEMLDFILQHEKEPKEKLRLEGLRNILLRMQRHKWKDILRKNNANCDALMCMLLKPSIRLVREIIRKTK